MCCADPAVSGAPQTEHTSGQRRAVTLAIIANVRLYREGLASALGSHDDLEIVGVFDCHASGLDRVLAADPQVVLIDVAARESLDVVRGLRQHGPTVRLVAFAVDEQESGLVAFAEAGVAGYVTCDASLAELAEILQSVAVQQFVCPPRLTATLLRRLAARGETGSPPLGDQQLTSREQQVLQLICDGLSNKEIAQAFNISEATVKNHVHHLLHKLQVHSRREAAARAPRTRRR